MIFKVARLGHPVLRQVAEPVAPDTITSPEVQEFIDDMIETMYEYDGAGLAAPQVHVSKQIVVMEVASNPRYPNAPDIPLTVYINPEITPLSDEKVEDWEGCLSVPGMRGRVPRHTRIRLQAYEPRRAEARLRGGGVSRPRDPARVRSRAGQGIPRPHDEYGVADLHGGVHQVRDG